MLKKLIKNKNAFTLIELIISVSIFGLIIAATFSIVNFVPRLMKNESAQFSERTDVRAAMVDISETIQNASSVAGPPLQFKMPDGTVIEYMYSSGKVNKIIDGKAYRLMESVDEFSLEADKNHLFLIHVRTAVEGRSYDLKVERRRGGSVENNLTLASITPEKTEFDKNPLLSEDIVVTMDLNGTSLVRLRNDRDTLNENRDYLIDDNLITIKKDYLTDIPNGTIYIVIDVSIGVDPILEIQIKDTGSNIKVAGNSLADDLVRMDYPGDLSIDAEDNKWIVTVTKGTVADDIKMSDLRITGLPAGISADAMRGAGNSIEITLSGTAAAPVTKILQADVIIKGSGVSEAGALDSDAIKVLLLPGASYASPEHNLLFTNELNLKNNAEVTGDIVIGREGNIANIANNSSFYGYVYSDSSLHAGNNTTFGSPSKSSKVFVKGSAIFDNNISIYGDLYYRDSLETKNGLTVTGNCTRRAVEIPPVIMPNFRTEQWYINNGYIMVNSASESVSLVDGAKYYFKTNYIFDDSIENAENIILVGKGSISFTKDFSGSGILFAPNGEIYFKNNCSLTGICVSKATTIENNAELIFRRYAELPFD